MKQAYENIKVSISFFVEQDVVTSSQEGEHIFDDIWD